MTASQNRGTTTATNCDDLVIAKSEVDGFVYQVSRVSVALHGLGDALADEDHPLPHEYRAGLCEALGLIGDYLESYANDRRSLVKTISAERLAAQAAEEITS